MSAPPSLLPPRRFCSELVLPLPLITVVPKVPLWPHSAPESTCQLGCMVYATEGEKEPGKGLSDVVFESIRFVRIRLLASSS